MATLLLTSLAPSCANPESASRSDHCSHRCTAADAAVFSAGRWNGLRIGALPSPIRLEYGPQGAQHFFLDVDTPTSLTGRVTFEVSFVEDASGRVSGSGRARMDSSECNAGTTVLVVMDDDRPTEGTIHVTASIADCIWSQAISNVELVAPLSGGGVAQPNRLDGAVFDKSAEGRFAGDSDR